MLLSSSGIYTLSISTEKKNLPILTTSEQLSVIENKSLLSFQYLPASSQSMLQPLVSDIFSVCILRELDGTRPQQLRFKTCTSSLGGQAGITCFGPLNTAADRGKVYCESQKKSYIRRSTCILLNLFDFNCTYLEFFFFKQFYCMKFDTTFVCPSSNCSISLLVGSQMTAGNRRVPGSTWYLLATSLPLTVKDRSPVLVSMKQPTTNPGEARLPELSWLRPAYLC